MLSKDEHNELMRPILGLADLAWTGVTVAGEAGLTQLERLFGPEGPPFATAIVLNLGRYGLVIAAITYFVLRCKALLRAICDFVTRDGEDRRGDGEDRDDDSGDDGAAGGGCDTKPTPMPVTGGGEKEPSESGEEPISIGMLTTRAATGLAASGVIGVLTSTYTCWSSHIHM